MSSIAMHAASIANGLQRLLYTRDHADLVVKCGDKTWQVHKIVVCAASAWFTAACRPDAFLEGQTASIDLTGADNETSVADEAHMIDAMIRFMYGVPEYDDNEGRRTNDRPLHLSKLYVTGVKYQVSGLMADALSKLEPELRLAGSLPYQDTSELLSFVYGNCPESLASSPLKAMVVEWLTDRCADSLTKSAMKQVVEDIPGLASDIIDNLVDRCSSDAPRRPPWCPVYDVTCDLTDPPGLTLYDPLAYDGVGYDVNRPLPPLLPQSTNISGSSFTTAPQSNLSFRQWPAPPSMYGLNPSSAAGTTTGMTGGARTTRAPGSWRHL